MRGILTAQGRGLWVQIPPKVVDEPVAQVPDPWNAGHYAAKAERRCANLVSWRIWVRVPVAALEHAIYDRGNRANPGVGWL